MTGQAHHWGREPDSTWAPDLRRLCPRRSACELALARWRNGATARQPTMKSCTLTFFIEPLGKDTLQAWSGISKGQHEQACASKACTSRQSMQEQAKHACARELLTPPLASASGCSASALRLHPPSPSARLKRAERSPAVAGQKQRDRGGEALDELLSRNGSGFDLQQIKYAVCAPGAAYHRGCGLCVQR